MPADDKDPSPSPPSSGAPHDEPDEAQSAKGGGDSTLPAEIEELLDQLPEEAQQKIDRLVSLTAYSHKGPIPSPADFAEYDRVRAGTADDIIQMSKDEQGIKKAALLGLRTFFSVLPAAAGSLLRRVGSIRKLV